MRLIVVAAMLVLSLTAAPASAETPTVRIAVLKYGTVNWLTDTIVANELDRAAGYDLDVVELAGRPATTIAFQAGDVDLIVADWVWALQQRERGRDLRFAPYSNALGALVADEAVDGICDLRGRPVGVVGGESDKSWLVLQALVRQECGFDLSEETTTLVGAAPLMSQQLLDGAVDAVSTYWHHAARLQAHGKARLIGVDEAMARLGITPAPPLIGFVWNADAVDAEAIDAFLRSVSAAQERMAGNDAEWDRLRPQMGAAGDAEFRLLRDHFRAGIVQGWGADETASAARLQALLIDAGGEAFKAEAGSFDPALFQTKGGDGR
jgi:NitT/TauT family transport system substrate-binding protein